MKKILIGSPCYNEEAVLNQFKFEVDKVISSIPDIKFDYLFVDDGSTDSTISILKEMNVENPNVHFISFSRNFGKEAGMKAIFDYAKYNEYDALIMLDSDLQDNPAIIPQLIQCWKAGYDHIYTQHKNRKGQSLIKKICSKMFYKIYSKLTGFKNIKNGARDFALYDKKVIEAYANYPLQERFSKGISSFVGFNKCCVVFDYQRRIAGKTKWSLKKLFKYAVLGFNSFSNWLKLFPKFLCLLFSSLCLFDIVWSGLHTGWSKIWFNTNIRIDILAIAICILTSVVISLGYQIKSHAENKPLYLIKEEK